MSRVCVPAPSAPKPKQTAATSCSAFVNPLLTVHNFISMLRVQFAKAAPAVVVRGQWFPVDIRLVNESNASVRAAGKVLGYIITQ